MVVVVVVVVVGWEGDEGGESGAGRGWSRLEGAEEMHVGAQMMMMWGLMSTDVGLTLLGTNSKKSPYFSIDAVGYDNGAFVKYVHACIEWREERERENSNFI